jgi:hypothetical protein
MNDSERYMHFPTVSFCDFSSFWYRLATICSVTALSSVNNWKSVYIAAYRGRGWPGDSESRPLALLNVRLNLGVPCLPIREVVYAMRGPPLSTIKLGKKFNSTLFK